MVLRRGNRSHRQERGRKRTKEGRKEGARFIISFLHAAVGCIICLHSHGETKGKRRVNGKCGAAASSELTNEAGRRKGERLLC